MVLTVVHYLCYERVTKFVERYKVAALICIGRYHRPRCFGSGWWWRIACRRKIQVLHIYLYHLVHYILKYIVYHILVYIYSTCLYPMRISIIATGRGAMKIIKGDVYHLFVTTHVYPARRVYDGFYGVLFLVGTLGTNELRGGNGARPPPCCRPGESHQRCSVANE